MSKILVVDDDVDILSLVKAILIANHFTVQTISEWERIDSSIRNFNPDLILLDVSLSGGDGIEICKRLKQETLTQHIPIILFSANIEMAKKVTSCGAQGYLAKPFLIKELLEIIRKNVLTSS